MAALPEWSTACLDWERRIVAGESLIPFEPLFQKQADAALRIFEQLVMVDVAGSPTMGEVSRPWVIDFVSSIFGAYDAQTGQRLIREFFLLISKKNAKSTTAAAIMLTALLLNWRNSDESLILAPTVEIAHNSFGPIRDMIRADDELSAIFHIQEHIRTITDRRTQATLKVVAADAETVGGKKASKVLIDELWIFGKRPKAENMLREATGGLLSRPEGFVVYLTTQSDEPPAGVFKQKLQYARAVRDGRIDDPQFLPVLYEFPQHMLEQKLHRDPEHFYVTNPNLGASVPQADLERMLFQAEEGGEESVVGFLAKHLNVEIGLALQSDRWAGADHWEESGEQLTLAQLLERSEVVTIGIDGGGLDDLLGMAVLGREKDTGRWLHWGKAWAHETVLERRKEIAPRLKDFERDGDLSIVSHVGDDVRELAEIILMIHETGLLPVKQGVGVDQIGLNFEEIFDEVGIPEDLLVGISQGYRLGGTIMTVERKLAAGAFVHGSSAMMAWCVSNCKVEQRSNSILITKQASGKAKIDPVMAILDAAQIMATNPSPSGKRYQMFFL